MSRKEKEALSVSSHGGNGLKTQEIAFTLQDTRRASGEPTRMFWGRERSPSPSKGAERENIRNLFKCVFSRSLNASCLGKLKLRGFGGI